MLSSLALAKGVRLTIEGRVQGVGFRPFIQRIALENGLSGCVRNSRRGVQIALFADDTDIQQFVQTIKQSAPKLAQIDHISFDTITPDEPIHGFIIEPSDSAYHAADIPPDQAICHTCREELTNSADRRHNFAFNSCTDCGPRFSIIESMPYDRPATAMHGFPLCFACQQEYTSLRDRRFHTEAMCCEVCGPQIQLADAGGQLMPEQGNDIISTSADWLCQGKILAIKGIGGFQLCCDAHNQNSIQRLRQGKNRPTKPFAIMMRNIQQVRTYFGLTPLETEQLCSAAAPIVLLPKRRAIRALPDCLAPGVDQLGVMLAYSPLHLLLLDKFAEPLVMTSGNRGSEPLCTDNEQAMSRLAGIADGFVLHDRQILNRCDDSVVKIINHKPRLLRRARGYVPAGIAFKSGSRVGASVLAMGGDIKNCFALSCNDKILLSGHNGDMAEPDCFAQTKLEIAHFSNLLNASPEAVVVDKHPDYFSTRLGKQLAKQYNVPLIRVQHHHAHLAACMVENNVSPTSPLLGIVLDGIGYGEDDTLWGGELLLADFHSSQRLGGLTPYPLLGGDKANLQPWRNLLALLHQAGQVSSLSFNDLPESLTKKLKTNQADALLTHQSLFPLTSSAGRLFDAVACLLGIAPEQLSYEGEAAMQLEALALSAGQDKNTMPTQLFGFKTVGDLIQLDPSPIWPIMLEKLCGGADKAVLAAWFHQCFVDSWVEMVCQVKHQSGDQAQQIMLSGGVFQNQLVLERMQRQLEARGFEVFSHCKVPSNDGGLALGQSAIALTQLEKTPCV